MTCSPLLLAMPERRASAPLPCLLSLCPCGFVAPVTKQSEALRSSPSLAALWCLLCLCYSATFFKK